MKNTKDTKVEIREPQIPGGEKTDEFFEKMFNQMKTDDKEVNLAKPIGYRDSEGKRQLKPGEKSVEDLANNLPDTQGENGSAEVFEGGQPVTLAESAFEVPQVPVSEAQVQPVQEEAQKETVVPEVTIPVPEAAAPSEEVAQAQEAITEQMEAQPGVRAEEEILETTPIPESSEILAPETVQEAGATGAGTEDLRLIRDRLVKGEGDLNTADAEAAEERIFSPLDEESTRE